MRLPAETPVVATPRVMALTAGGLYLAGAIAGAAISWSLDDRSALLMALTAAAAVGGLVIVRFGEHFPLWGFHTVAASASAILALAAWSCPTPTSALAVASLTPLVAIDVAFFFTWRSALVHLAVALGLQTVALHRHPSVDAGPIAALFVVVLVVGIVVGLLVQHAGSASVDRLTGLANRRGFDDALAAAISTADRTRRPLSVLIIDIDHFQQTNDRLGPAAGDELLRKLAAHCRAQLPRDAVLARHGGDEFAVVLPGTTGAEAMELSTRIRRTDHRHATSHGVAQLRPRESARDLVQRADKALQNAKACGRGRSVRSSAEADQLALDLAEAIAGGEVVVALQPIVALPGRDVVGVEALARWTHHERGPVPPDQFVAAAETTDLIIDLGALVMATACRDALALCTAWGRPLVLTVNVSGRELVEPGYADAVARVLTTTGWPADQLVVEVTESLLDASSSAALAALVALRRTGVRVAIDDFGTGYSSFARLDTVPADYLKLDHTFISAITTSTRRAGMLTALLALSRTLGLCVIAEGVETVQQAEMLTALGCPLVQGYYFDRPQPVAALLARHRVVDPAGGPQPSSAASPAPDRATTA